MRMEKQELYSQLETVTLTEDVDFLFKLKQIGTHHMGGLYGGI